MVPTIVGLSVIIVGLTAWNVYLTVFMFDVRDTSADALDSVVQGWERLSGRVTALESPAYPKYLGTLTGSQTDADGCEGIDPVWGEHDQRVKEALSAVQSQRTGAINTDPEEHPFFIVTEDQSEQFDADTIHRLNTLVDPKIEIE